MVGYENIMSHGQNVAVLSFSITFALFAVYGVLQEWGGMSGDYYGNLNPFDDKAIVPVVSWEKKDNSWVQVLDHDEYGIYLKSPEFKWIWIPKAHRMGWVQADPDPEVTIICSEGLEQAVDEILSNARTDGRL